MMYIFIYRLRSEDFMQDRYIEVDCCNGFVEAFVNFYDRIENRNETCSSYSDMMKYTNGIDDMLDFLSTITTEDIEIVDAFAF